ncbi:MAG: hypothetical protein U5L00_13810 [Desulfovermiculus sp.]|nr:hypothetical protein [Desulfovermiculus sp.]
MKILHLKSSAREFKQHLPNMPNLWVFGLYLALSCLYTYPQVMYLGTKIINYTSKPWQHDWWYSVWALHFGPDILSHLATFDLTYIKVFYPLGMPIGYYSQLIFATLASYPLTQIFSLEVASNVLIIISLAASGYTSYLLAAYLLGSRGFALIAGWIFLSSPIMIAQASSHLLLLTTAWSIPLYILFLIKTTENPKVRNTLFLSCSAIVLTLGYLQYLNMLFIFTLLFLVMQFLRKKLYKRQIIHLSLSFVIYLPSLIVVVPILLDPGYDYLSVTLSQITYQSVDLLGLFLPDRNQILFGSVVQEIRDLMRNNPVLHSAYIGWIVIFLSFIGLLAKKHYHYFFLCMALLFSILSLGPTLHIAGDYKHFLDLSYHLPYVVYYKILNPFVLSDCSIFFILAMICWSVTACFGLQYIHNKINNFRLKKILIGTACILLLIDFFPKPHDMLDIPTTEPYRIVANDQNNFSVLHLPYRMDQIINLYFQTKHEKNMLNAGYPRRLSETYHTFANNFPVMDVFRRMETENLNTDSVAASDSEVFQWFFDLQYIFVHKGYLPEGGRAARKLLTELFPLRSIHEDDHLQIFQLGPPPSEKKMDILPLHFDFDGYHFPALQTGWSKPEEHNQLTWQWSNSPQSKLLFKAPASDSLEITYRVQPAPHLDKQQRMKIYFDEHMITEQGLQPGYHQYQVVIPGHLVHAGHHSLVFEYAHTLQPCLHTQSTDCRNLGVAFDNLNIHIFDGNGTGAE